MTNININSVLHERLFSFKYALFVALSATIQAQDTEKKRDRRDSYHDRERIDDIAKRELQIVRARAGATLIRLGV